MNQERLIMKNYYAFTYLDGIDTTWAHNPNRICGYVHKFNSLSERDSFVRAMNFTTKNDLKPCNAVTRKMINKMGHGDYFSVLVRESCA